MVVLFSDGQIGSLMETAGDFSAWTGVTGVPTVQNAVKHHGINAMSSSAWNDTAFKTLAATGTVYTRFYVQWTQNPNPAGTKTILAVENAGLGQGFYVQVLNDGGVIKWRILVNENDFAQHTYTAAAPNPTTGTWYCIECSWIKNTVGGAKLWIDGALVLTGGAPRDANVDRISIGGGDGLGSIYSDCVVVADAYSGVEGGATIFPQKNANVLSSRRFGVR